MFHVRSLIATGVLAIALSGCLSTQQMAPVSMPSRPAQLKLCTKSPVAPPHDLASNPNFVEFSGWFDQRPRAVRFRGDGE